jgi:cell division septal protein FtsQ
MDNDPTEGRGVFAWAVWIGLAWIVVGCVLLLAACVFIGPIAVDRKIGVEGNVTTEKEEAPAKGAERIKPAS